jgi:hypothetical protein
MTAFFVRMLLTLSLLAATAVGLSAWEWRVLTDDRYATQIEFPADVFTELEESPEGLVATGSDARLEMSAIKVEGVKTAADLRALIEGSEGYEDMTYTPSGSRWLVVSGYRGTDIYYEKFLIRPELVRGFSVQYPTAKREVYDPIVERLEDTFRVESKQ